MKEHSKRFQEENIISRNTEDEYIIFTSWKMSLQSWE